MKQRVEVLVKEDVPALFPSWVRFQVSAYTGSGASGDQRPIQGFLQQAQVPRIRNQASGPVTFPSLID